MKADIEREIAALKDMTTGELCERYALLFGEQTRARHKAYLVRKLAWRIQCLAEGGLTERAQKRADELAVDADVRVMPPKSEPRTVKAVRHAVVRRDPRVPTPGTAITRRYKGRTLQVVVLEDGGFEYDGARYKSLSAVAKFVTGTHTNGFRFFGLEDSKE